MAHSEPFLKRIRQDMQDALAKKEKQRHLVIPAKAGIQYFQEVAKGLDTGFHSCNRRFHEMWGLPPQSARGEDAVSRCMEIIREQMADPDAFTHLSRLSGPLQQELRLLDKRTLLFHAMPARQDHSFAGSIWYFYDISEQVQLREQLHHLAFYDELTGLPNRRLFHDLLKHCLAGAQRNNGMVGVLFLDLDNFKQVNDAFGHAAGDRFLCNTATILRDCLREVDLLCRWGGDEFVLALPSINAQADAEHVAEKLLRTVATSPALRNLSSPKPSLSIGISLFPRDGQGADTLVRQADMAMYQAKILGKNRYCALSPQN